MSEAQSFAGWAMLELMGHRQRVGFVHEVTIAGASMLQIDIPTGDGAVVTEVYNGPSIYSIKVLAEEVARDMAARLSDPRPMRPAAYRDRPAALTHDDRYDDDLPR